MKRPSQQVYTFKKTNSSVDSVSEDNRYQCLECVFSTSRESFFNKHEKLHDEQNNSLVMIYSCDQCGYLTKNNPSFREHLHNHKTDRNYFCVSCDLLFKRKRALKIHVQREHNDWF
jgi:KRAB domain-containing zinc finger protein